MAFTKSEHGCRGSCSKIALAISQEETYTRVVLRCMHIFVFVALRPMSTAMVIAGRSVHLTTLFPGQA